MKRSEMVEKIAQFVYDATDRGLEVTKEEADLILQFIEEAGMKPPQVEFGYDEGPTGAIVDYSCKWEPEEEWDAYLEAQDLKDQARDFQVMVEVNSLTGKHTTSRSKDVAQKFLEGKSFEELAQEYNVTRERIRQIVAKERRKYEKYMSDGIYD